jgi:zinc transporter ZupT
MKNQTVMGPLVELPGWLQAAGWGLLSASGLLIGAVGGYYTRLQHTTISRVMTFAAGVLLADIPEALSSSAGMRHAGRSARYVFGVWIGIALMISLAAAVAGLVLRGTGRAVRGTVEAFAAGAILALVSETMIPEAFHGSPQFNGLLLVVGFVALLILLALSH